MGVADILAAAPKLALHDHLDGGLRPSTIVELAAEAGLALPTTDPQALGQWFFDQANSGSLARYLTTFDVTLAVMQTAANLRRVAREWALDLAADNVVYGEARWAPAQHIRQGLSLEDAIRAVRDGLADGEAEARAAGHPIIVRQLITQLRGMPVEPALAELAIAYRDDSVAGMDCAGAEAGFHNADYAAVFDTARRAGVFVTIHAGEAAGLESIIEGLVDCGAVRLGHGVRLADDISADPVPRLGPVANYVTAMRIPLEVCPTSNLQTGVASDMAHHPFDQLYRAGVTLTVNCDNRLMSATTPTLECVRLAEAFGYGLSDFRQFALNAAHAAFLPRADREALAHDVVLPGFAALA